MPLNILITLAIEPEQVRRIEAAAPDLRVRRLGPEKPRQGIFASHLQSYTTAAELQEALPSADVLFGYWGLGSALANLPDFRSLAPDVRWVQMTQAGAEFVDPALIDSGIVFTTAGGLSATPIAEFVLAYMLMFSKGWPRLWRSQQAHKWDRTMPRELYGRTVGIVGMGQIGTAIAGLARAFGCRVLGMRRSFISRGPDAVADEAVPPSDLPYLLAESDFVVLSAPSTAETRGLIGAEQLRQMKPSAYLINVGRGELIDEPALIEALQGNVIAGAGLDTFAAEPLPTDSPLWGLDNAIITSHTSAGTEIYMQRATDIFIANLQRFLAGQPLNNVVDPSRGY